MSSNNNQLTVLKLVKYKYDNLQLVIHFTDGSKLLITRAEALNLGLYKDKQFEPNKEIINKDHQVFLFSKLYQLNLRSRKSPQANRAKAIEYSGKRQDLTSRINGHIFVDYTYNLENLLLMLEEKGYGAEAYASMYLDSLLNKKKFGPRKIYTSMIAKGISKDIVSKVLEKYSEEEKEEAKKKVLLKKFGYEDIADIEDFKIRQKAYRFLAYRGFV